MQPIPIERNPEIAALPEPNEPGRFVNTLFDELLRHDGFASFKVEMRILKRRQKEIIVDCGKQYRFVLDFEPERPPTR